RHHRARELPHRALSRGPARHRRRLRARLQSRLQPLLRVFDLLQLPDSAARESALRGHPRRRSLAGRDPLSAVTAPRPAPELAAARDRAAAEAARLVEDGMVVGLGTGDTAGRFLERLAARVRDEVLAVLT